METLTKATALSLLLICFGIGLLVVVVLELLRPPVSRMESMSEESIRLEANWFTHRTFRLLTGKESAVKGIDLKQLKQKNLFARPAKTSDPVVEPEPVVEKAPPTPPPATRRVEAVYRGLYRNSRGEVYVYVELEGTTRVLPVGGTVASVWTVAEANVNELQLKKGKGAEVKLPLNRKKSLEVPIP